MEPKIIRSSEGRDLMNGRQNIKLNTSDTGGELAVIYSKVPAGSGIPVHIHSREDETFQITEGELEVTIGGETHRLTAGDMIFMPKDIPHGFKAVRDTAMWVTFNPGGGEQMFEEMSDLPPGPPDMVKVAAIADSYGVSFV